MTWRPTTEWHLNYAEESCRLVREFASDDKKAVLYLEEYETGAAFTLLVASPAFRTLAGKSVTVGFGPGGQSQTVDQAFSFDFGDFGPAVMVTSMGLLAPLSVTDPKGRVGKLPGPDHVPDIATPEEEAAITWFEMGRRSTPQARFELGSMRKPLDAMRACTDDLMAQWGIDVAAHKTLSRSVAPATNPSTWVSNSDYPRGLAAQGIQGLINFRLMVDETGNVTGCHIQQSTRPVEFDKTVCAIMTKRARFTPALDAAGKPIKSFWRSSFRFQMP